ncbi:MAG TPA: phosphomethylpyrimidine synthase ThiC [Candidatus Saccharicenans sp.]|nr:phosphomethylpyrimidine synthase ThiC [Candidatus Saccharicenans sp.]HOM94687.1 phosphomethylpyrimidine synthase ThiC [Candidatus Saccharicenans sp.]HOT68723.1 phosphomethylpyrimidine synthase ThiC [Candidatus Saccharicenans sp.]HPC87909.1 phosphomethylpyrimidine synthase ThiC [Candidatus Saccharicenans sp.]HQE64195.1 phosphomethylpyrimidine synthase ThiC [Candidatus Saccharicenans sp.]
MTLVKQARKGILTPFLKKVAAEERLEPDELLSLLASGEIVIPYNKRHKSVRPVAIGRKMRTKVNVNLGTSRDYPDLQSEIAKLKLSLKYQTDAVMDLSTGGDIRSIRKKLLTLSTVPLGTVPVYQAAIEAIEKRGSIVEMTEDDLFETIRQQAEEGVDFMTVHCGLTIKAVDRLKKQGRIADIVSRGGAFHLAWMLRHQKENPLYANFDRLLDIARKYDVTLSLGDGLRPGAIFDATDRPQIEELLTLGELVRRAREADVQVMVEGPGHVPLDQITMNIKLEKRICEQAPFYVLGPLVTDIAPGYDHLVSAIGGAIAAAAGADFLCYVTPAEHLGLPSLDDVKDGLIAARIAGHAADIVKGVPGAIERDFQLSKARKKLDWETQQKLAIDPIKFAEIRKRRKSKTTACSMCGDFCAMKIVSQFLNGEADDSCF